MMESRYSPEQNHRRFTKVFTLAKSMKVIIAITAALTVYMVMISIQSGYSYKVPSQDYNQSMGPNQDYNHIKQANQDNKLNHKTNTTELSHDEEFPYQTAYSNGLLAEMFKTSDHHRGCKMNNTKPCPKTTLCRCIPCKDGTRVDCTNKTILQIPTELPDNTTVLLLQHNNISEINAGTLQNYKNLTKLDISYNKLMYLEQDNFNGLVHLHNLSMIHNNITNIAKGTFASLTNIYNIDLSYNLHLGLRSLENMSYRLENTSITKINLTHVYNRDIACVEIVPSAFKHLSKTNIRYLILDSNQLVSLTLGAVEFIPKSLKGISLRDNRLSFGPYLYSIFRWVLDASNLEIVIMSQQNTNHIIDGFSHLEKLKRKHWIKRKETNTNQSTNNECRIRRGMKGHGWQRMLKGISSQRTMLNQTRYTNLENTDRLPSSMLCLPIQLPQNLLYLDLSEDHVRTEVDPLCFCQPNNLRELKVNRNMLWKFRGPITGLTHLEILDISGNSCSELSESMLHDLPNLKLLNLSHNFLVNPLRKDKNGLIFQKLGNLTNLDLSVNNLYKLPDKIFSGLKKLAILSLASNHLTKFKVSIENMVHLKKLDLQRNFLRKLDESVTSFFDKIQSRNQLELTLSNNLFDCTCNELHFIKWISETKVKLKDLNTYSCEFSNGTKGNLIYASHIYNTLRRECAAYTFLIMSSILIIVLFLVLVLVAIMYRYRWNLQYMYYSTKIKHRGHVRFKNEQKFDFDVFVSYCDTDNMFIRQHIIPELEEKQGLNLLIHERDFLAGNFVADNIMRAITTSRKVLIILTKNYLGSTWCCYEMNMARMEHIKTGRDVICVLMKESIPSKDLPLELIDIIRNQTYLKLPPVQQDLTCFWERMKIAMLE